MRVYLKKLHKWVGLLIGIQLLLWLTSGLMISLLNPEKVSGQHWARAALQEQQSLPAGMILEPHELPAGQLSGALRVDLTLSQGKPVYHIQRAEGETLLNAVDGSIITTDETEARSLAELDFSGDGEIISVERGTAPDRETRNSLGEYWRVNFSDSANTSIYISVATGQILERRNSYWRVRDFFWMLHIMDYVGREDLNNSLVITVSLVAVWLGISGFILLFGSFNRHDFHFLNLLGKRDVVRVTLIDPSLAKPRQVSLRKGSNLFLSLATHDINLPSVCGGGGECGQCRVKMETAALPAANAIERALVPGRLLEQGFRLACQHQLKNAITLRLKKGLLAVPDTVVKRFS